VTPYTGGLAFSHSGGLVELVIALRGEDHSSHLVALGQDDLVDLAAAEAIEEVAELAHRLPDRRQLIIGYPKVRLAHGPYDTKRRGQMGDRPSAFRPRGVGYFYYAPGRAPSSGPEGATHRQIDQRAAAVGRSFPTTAAAPMIPVKRPRTGWHRPGPDTEEVPLDVSSP
jgi:hypothetical protein